MMKKSAIALGVIVALGAVWTGSSWYVGQRAEAEYQYQIDKANKVLSQELKIYGAEGKIDNVKFNRGVFSSDVSYDIVLKLVGQGEALELPFVGKLYHGPLPINSFTPALFSAGSELVKNEKTQSWFDNAQGKNPFSNKFTYSFSNTLKGDFDIPVIKVPTPEANVTFSGVSGSYDMNREGLGKMALKLASFDSQAIKNKVSAFFEIKDIDMQFDLVQSKWKNIQTGKQNITLGSILLRVQNDDEQTPKKENLVWVENIKTSGTSYLDGEFVGADSTLTADKIAVKDIDFGKLQLDLVSKHLDANALDVILTALKTMDENGNIPMQKELENAAEKLIKNEPQLTIKPLKLTNSAGTAWSADLNVELEKFDENTLQKSILALLKQFSLNVSADKAGLIQAVEAFGQLEGKSAEEAKVYAAMMVEAGMKKGVADGTLVAKGDGYVSNLVLENGELKLNGKVIPENQIQMFLFMLMMAAGSGLN